MRRRSYAAAVLLVLAAVTRWGASEPAADTNRYAVTADGYYGREPKDGVWHIRLVGEIPSLCGAYLVVHDAAGRTVHHGPIPHGLYPAERPFDVAIPADGRAGDYKIVLVGHQRDKLGVTWPFTDLDAEVFGGCTFAISRDAGRLPAFRAPPGIDAMKLGAYKGHLQVLDEAGTVVADTRVSGVEEKYDRTVEFAVTTGAVYRLKRDCFYFRDYLGKRLFMAFDPARWFFPDPALDDVAWWEGVQP